MIMFPMKVSVIIFFETDSILKQNFNFFEFRLDFEGRSNGLEVSGNILHKEITSV